MSTRSNILLKDDNGQQWFYRHNDGYPEGAMPTIAEFVRHVENGSIRPYVRPAAGWLVALGMQEYGNQVPQKGSKLADWKVGTIEPTTGEHGDIEYLYTITLKEAGEIGMEGIAEVVCHAVGYNLNSFGEEVGPKTYRSIDVSKFLDSQPCEHPVALMTGDLAATETVMRAVAEWGGGCADSIGDVSCVFCHEWLGVGEGHERHDPGLRGAPGARLGREQIMSGQIERGYDSNEVRVLPWREYDPADVAQVVDPFTGGAIQQVDQHEREINDLYPYTDAERVEVHQLFEEERAAIRDYYFGAVGLNLTGIRLRIASDRVKISRTARKRMSCEACGREG